MRDAYAYADGGEISREILLGRLVERFGALAVLGRATIGAGEMRRMLTAERVVQAYQDRQRSPNWAAWAMEHPDESELLVSAMAEET